MTMKTAGYIGTDHIPVLATIKCCRSVCQKGHHQHIPKKQRNNRNVVERAKQVTKSHYTKPERGKVSKKQIRTRRSLWPVQEDVAATMGIGKGTKINRLPTILDTTFDAIAKQGARLYRRALTKGTEEAKREQERMDKMI